MSWCSLSRMAQVSHGNICRVLLVFLLCSVRAVFDLDSKFDMEGKSFAEPSFDEMDPSRGWRFLDVPSEPHVGPLGDWFSTPDVTPPLHECDLPFAGNETDCGVLFKSASDISVFETLGHAMVRHLSVAGLVTSFKVLMGLDEFWEVYMSAAIAAAFCFAATWLWIAQERRDPLWSFVILWFSFGFQFLTLCWFATLAAAVAALWEVGVMEADVLLVANKRYVQKEDKKHFLKVLQHTAIFGHPSILSGLGAVVATAVGSYMVGSRPEVSGYGGSCMLRCVLLACGA